MTWSSGPTRTSTAAWRRIRKQAKHDLPYLCAHCGVGEPLELDHVINHKTGGTDDMSNLQWLCPTCHMRKTQKEAAKARNSWKRPPEKHPGLK